jgi:tRNA (Thr-GGU) A37 N-methylase
MNNRLTSKQREHLGRVKSLPCSVCNHPAPSQAHHIKQHRQYTCVALCESCHMGSLMGLHEQKRAWVIAKMDELDALNITIERLQ